MQTLEPQPLTWSEIKELFREYRMVILCVFLGGVLGTYAVLQVAFTELYETTAGVLVKTGRENVETPATVQNGQMLSQGVRDADINSEVQMLSSRALVEDVVDKLGPDAFKSVLRKPDSIFGYPKYALKWSARQVKNGYKELLILTALKKRLTPREEAIQAAGDGLKVAPVKESDTLTVTVRMPSPGLAVAFTNSLLDFYLKDRVAARANPGGISFFTGELNQKRELMRQAERAREAVRAEWGISSAAEQRSLRLKELSDIETEIAMNESEIARLRQQSGAMSAQIAQLPAMMRKEEVTAPNPSIQSIKDRLAALQVERAQLAARYQPGADPLQAVESEIASLESVLNRQQPTIVSENRAEANPTTWAFRQEIETENVKIAGLQARDQQLAVAAGQIRGVLRRLDRGGDVYEGAERDYRLAENNYVIYTNKQEQERISAALDARDVANVAVYARPSWPFEPVFPRKVFLVEIAIPLSLALAILVAALLNSLDDRIRTGRDLSQLEGVAFLGSVPVPRPAVVSRASARF